MNTKILLIVPPARIFSVVHPIGLLYMRAVLKRHGFNAVIRDYSCRRFPTAGILADIRLLKPAAIGFNVYTFAFNTVKKLISEIRRLDRRTPVIVGGPHVSALPEFSLQELDADFAVVGEGELVTAEILRRMREGRNDFEDLGGVAFRSKGRAVFRPGVNLVEDLDSLPCAYEGEELSAYDDIPGGVFHARGQVAQIITSRGCPNQCTVCAAHRIHGRRLRLRSAVKVVDEIELLAGRGIRDFAVIDANFIENKSHALGVCNEILRRGLKISWQTSVGVCLRNLDEELLGVFKRSGCSQLSFGIESFSQPILTGIRKPLVKSQIPEKLALVKKYKIAAGGFFMLGLPGDTESSIRETLKFARESDFDFISYTHTVPLPGSELFESWRRGRDLKTMDWDNFFFFSSRPFNLSSVPAGKMRQFYARAYLGTYFAPKRLKKILAKFFLLKDVRISKVMKFIYFIAKNALGLK